jgi:hypothetical protein
MTHQLDGFFYCNNFFKLEYYLYICYMKTIEVTYQEIKMATRPNVYRNRKKYTRKEKHKGNNY